jgi:hypothetical protein
LLFWHFGKAKETSIPAELSLLTLRQLCISRVDGRNTHIIFEMTCVDQNLIHGRNGNNVVFRHLENSCHAENWMSEVGL